MPKYYDDQESHNLILFQLGLIIDDDDDDDYDYALFLLLDDIDIPEDLYAKYCVCNK